MDWMLYLQAFAGLAVFVGLALLFSNAPRRVEWKVVVGAIALQFAICFLLLQVPMVRAGFAYLTRAVNALSEATGKGTAFIFGYLGGGSTPFAVTDPGSLVTFALVIGLNSRNRRSSSEALRK